MFFFNVSYRSCHRLKADRLKMAAGQMMTSHPVQPVAYRHYHADFLDKDFLLSTAKLDSTLLRLFSSHSSREFTITLNKYNNLGIGRWFVKSNRAKLMVFLIGKKYFG